MKSSPAEGVALVAGGSGGIGSAIVRRLSSCGLKVALTYHRGREAAEALSGETCRAFPWSGGGFDASAALVRRVTEELGPVRYLVVASGCAQQTAFHRLDEEAARQLLDTNLSAPIGLAHAVVTPMMKAGRGRIVFIGSVSGQRGIKGHTVYAATKAGLEGLTRSLAQEAALFDVTVNCVAPGFIDTPMLDAVPDRQREGWLKSIPLRRLGRPEEIAGAVAYLLSDEAAYITGQTITIDGGVSL